MDKIVSEACLNYMQIGYSNDELQSFLIHRVKIETCLAEYGKSILHFIYNVTGVCYE